MFQGGRKNPMQFEIHWPGPRPSRSIHTFTDKHISYVITVHTVTFDWIHKYCFEILAKRLIGCFAALLCCVCYQIKFVLDFKEEKLAAACPMSFTWASHILWWTLPNQYLPDQCELADRDTFILNYYTDVTLTSTAYSGLSHVTSIRGLQKGGRVTNSIMSQLCSSHRADTTLTGR